MILKWASPKYYHSVHFPIRPPLFSTRSLFDTRDGVYIALGVYTSEGQDHYQESRVCTRMPEKRDRNVMSNTTQEEDDDGGVM